MRRRASRLDANHREVVKAIRAIVPFCDLSSAGDGLPDGIAWIQGAWRFAEIKNNETAYGRKGLNRAQRDFVSAWPGAGVYVLRSVDDGIAFALGRFERLEFSGGTSA